MRDIAITAQPWRVWRRAWLLGGLVLLLGAGPGAPPAAAGEANASAAHAAANAAQAQAVLGLTAAEREFLAAHPVLRVGVNRTAPPFSYEDGGRHRGIDAEILRRLGQALGVKIEPVLDRPWPEVQTLVRNGGADLLALVPAAPERAEYLRYTEPVTDIEYALFVRQRRDEVEPLDDLTGRRVAVVGSFAVRQWLERDFPGVVVVPVASAIEGLTRLSTGEVDGAVSTVGAAAFLIRQQGLVNLHLDRVLYRAPLVVGVRRDWPELVTILNKAIAQVDRRDIDRIKADYIGLRAGRYSREQLTIAVLATVAAALALTAVLMAVSARRRAVAQRALAVAHGRLQQEEARYRLLFEHNLDGVLQTTPEGAVLEANRVACELLRMSEDELRRGGRGAVVDEQDPTVQALLRERAERGVARGVVTMRRGDGSRFEADIASAVYTSTDGTRLSSVVIRDITERRRAESELRLLQAAVSKLNDIVMITEAEPFEDPGPRIVFVNEAFTRLTGYTRDEVIGRSPRLLQGPRTNRAELARIGESLRRWQPVRAEVVNYAKDGHEFWLELQIVPLADENGWFTHWVAIEREIGERKQAEESRRLLESQLREAQKMEAIGTLAGGIAHDFNNILGAILGNAALAAQDVGPSHPAATSLEQIRLAGQRARSLVQQILAFSRHEAAQAVVQPIAPPIREAVSLLRSTLPAQVRLDLELDEAPLPVSTDATQMHQVVMNLCTNAWQAMGDRPGRILVRLVRTTVAAGDATLALPPGDYARLSIVDNGAGMDAATQSRVFEPFFTTKPAGEGTGLGLSVVHGIVTAHGGAVRVSSQLGVGTTFDLYFPVVADAAAPGAPASLQPVASAPAGRGERIAYIDDDEVMLLMVDRLLHRQGYEVTIFSSGREAIAAVRAQPEAFDMVVTDYNMPDTSGLDVAQALRDLRPDLPVVVSTGFVSEKLQADAARLNLHVMHKEQTLEQIGRFVREALDAPA